MRATLIEIDHGLPEKRWYAKYEGARAWAMPSLVEGMWAILDGQDLPPGVLIAEEDAWSIREAEVELRLVEIPADAKAPD